MLNLTEVNLIIIIVPILLITIFILDQSLRKKINTNSEEKAAFLLTFIRFFLVSFVSVMFFSADVLIFKTIATMNFTPEMFSQNKDFFKYAFLFLAFQLVAFGSNFGLANIAGVIEKISKAVRKK